MWERLHQLIWPVTTGQDERPRYKAWRCGPDAELHVIVYDGAELPLGISSLGLGFGSKEADVANPKATRAMLRDVECVVVRDGR